MRPASGKYDGRIVFCAVRNAYQGSVPVWSDDGGRHYNYSSSLHLPGMDECQIAQAPDGSLYLIARNCWPSTAAATNHSHLECRILRDANGGDSYSNGGGSGGGPFYNAFSVSTNGGETWSSPRLQPQLHTPIAQSSLVSHKNALYYSSPYSYTERRANLTILAADDQTSPVATNATTMLSFSRSLRLWPGMAGYTGLACGLPGRDDCAVLFEAPDDGMSWNSCHLNFMRFASADVTA